MSDVLKELKTQADKLDVNYSPNIGEDTLRKRINEAILSKADEQQVAVEKAEAEETEGQRNQRLNKAATKLVRIRLNSMNPADSKKKGIRIQGGNSVTGTIGKYIPFNVAWMVPQILVNVVAEKQHQMFIEKENKYGITRKVTELVKSYSIDVLPDLTGKELEELKAKQKAAGNLED